MTLIPQIPGGLPFLPLPGRYRPGNTAPMPSARSAGRAVIAFDDPRFADQGRTLLAETLRSARFSAAFTSPRGLTAAQRSRVLDRLIADTRAELEHLARRLDDGTLSLAAWHRRSAEVLAAGHHAAAFASLGSVDLDGADRAAIHAEIDRELGYLARFRGEIQAGVAGVTTEGLTARARLYGSALWAASQEVRRTSLAARGWQFERRILDDGPAIRHCSTCPAEAERGWQPVGVLRRIGDSECRTQCRCRWAMRKTEPPPGG